MMNLDFFMQSLCEICDRSLVSPGRSLNCYIIVNPVSGGFVIRSKWKSNTRIMNEYKNKAQINQKRKFLSSTKIIKTEKKGAGGEIAGKILEEAAINPVPFHLIISAGGDGTHSEIMLALYNAPAHVRSNAAVLRLPLGTGNDGADCANLAGALDLLINPVNVYFQSAVQLTTSKTGKVFSQGPFLAFNILSVGLDSFVTHMTNKMKGKLPGDSYKLWVNIAALLYDKIYNVDFIDVKAFDNDNAEIKSFNEKLLLLAMGVSGHRTYGSQEKILSDDRNVCAVKQMSFFRKLAIKGQVTKGKHTANREVIMLDAHRLLFSCRQQILAQMDGETVTLLPEDFPAVMEITAPVIPLLKICAMVN